MKTMKFILLVFYVTVTECTRMKCRYDADFDLLRQELAELKEANNIKMKNLQEETKNYYKGLMEENNQLKKVMSEFLPQECKALKMRGSLAAISVIKPPNLPLKEVRCDQHTDGGGWTVILSRENQLKNDNTILNNKSQKESKINTRENFNRTWEDYKDGFGDPRHEYWIGNDVISALTQEGGWEARVLLTNWDHTTTEGFWGHFRVMPEKDKYQLVVGKYDPRSTSGDGLEHHNHSFFSTYDRENEIYIHNHCARTYGAGWWFHQCHVSLLTGAPSDSMNCDNKYFSIHWNEGCPLKAATFMIRPVK